MGIDPGARNIGYACSGEKALLLAGVIRYGRMADTRVIELVYYVIQEFTKIFKDARCPKNINIEDQPSSHTGLSHAVSMRIHAVQAALFALAISNGKRVRCTSPTEWKKAFGWKYMGGYDKNKQWAIDTCRNLYFESWMRFLPIELRKSDHVCDAKLLAEQYKRVILNERSAAASSTPEGPAPACPAEKRSGAGIGSEQEPSSKGRRIEESGEATGEGQSGCCIDEPICGERPPELAVESLLHLPGFDVFEADS